jgi:hypothetical protein
MSVRRTALIIAIFVTIGCGLGPVQADAASTPRGQAATSVPVLYGGHCVTVRSNAHGWRGTICVYLARQSGTKRGEVTFTANSGLLSVVSVETLQLSANHHVIEKARNSKRSVVTIGGVIPLNWWDEPAGSHLMQAGAYDACMTWKGGGTACTGASWLYSHAVAG